MLLEILCAALIALPADSADRPFSLALPGINAVNLVPGEGEMRTELIAQKVIAHGIKVITGRDLTAVLGLDRQKQLMGCAENACNVELMAAMGANGVMVGDLARISGQYTLTLKVLSAEDGHVLAFHSARAGSEAELDEIMESSVFAVLTALADATHRADLRPKPAVVTQPAGPSLRTWAIAPTALGVLAMGAGAVLQFLAGNAYSDLLTHSYPVDTASLIRSSGQRLETGGNWSLLGGGIALAAALVLFVVGSSASPPTAFSPQGASLPVVGVWP